ncbi:hypothetical protein [Algoriphagus aquimarinus]|uniref:NERD domain-containing protein n=1 Tax=Algoriphagus aquimarinus TaxID=237018 RepID=A0A1I1B057_9BACT|nr:hypothetical protein [Algoriphagus aquimarinus]SFB43735.1 hypothetical protein SAMN04489723_11073 [Algoriphagus aquimarinus]
MDFEKINFKKVDKSVLKKNIIDNKNNTPSKKVIKELLKKIETSVLNADYLIARNTLLVTLFYAPDDTFDFIRRKGIFRYSRYANKKCIVKSIATELVEICKEYGHFSNETFTYLDSIINYSTVLDSYNAFERHIVEELKRFERKHKDKSIVKTLLSATDFLFLSGFYPKTNTDLSEITNRPKEDISSAVSFLIHIYTDRINSDNINTGFVSEEYIRSGEISKLIIPACYYSDFKEFEVMIDHFDYSCSLVAGQLYINPPFEDFEKSIRAGYIRTEIQQANDRVNTIEAASIEELVEKLNSQEELKIFKLTETHNYPRYRVELPEPIYEFIIEKFIKPDNLFKDEVIYLSLIFKEQLLNPTDLNKIKVKDDLTLYEFIKVRRVFVLFYLMFAKEIYKIEKIDTDLLFRSLIPVYQVEQFYEFLGKLLPSEKIDSFLDIVCWEPGSDFIFDLQYHPILYLNNSFLIPLSIFANSNSIRNLFASEYKQSNSGLLNSGETLVSELKETFNSISIPAYSETEIGDTDIDVCAVYQDTLFVFECKHTLHPVSSYDLRTTYDYIRKAESQLDKINRSFQEGKLLPILERKLGIKTVGINRISSCIVLSNRLFNGNIFKYPIRNINEVINMLTKGRMRTESGTFNVWTGKSLTIDFMLDYFSLSNKMTTLLMDSLSKRTLTYEFAKPMILFDSYFLELEIAIPKLKEFTDGLEKFDSE